MTASSQRPLERMDIVQELERRIRTIRDFPEAGIAFKDITPILQDPDLLRYAIDALAWPFLRDGVTKVVGIESRGFILGAMLAHRLGAGFVPVRKQGKLPHETVREEYELEYGTDTIEMHVDALEDTDRVLIHDDVIATGGTASATHRLVRQTRGDVLGFSFLVELDALGGREMLDASVRTHSVLRL